MENKNTLIVTVIILVVATFLGAIYLFNRDTNNDVQGDSDSTIGESIEVADITIQMKDFKFSPSTIEASSGETVKIKLVGMQGEHDFVIDELNIRSPLIEAGEDRIVTITIPADTAPGNYEFYCSVGDHRVLGMTGTLQVE